MNKVEKWLLVIGSVTARLSRIKRAPRYPDGQHESDVEHSYHLGLSTVELATLMYPELDIGLVAQFSLVHDLPEIYAGDMRTFNASEDDLRNKKVAEGEATERLLGELPPYLARLLERYEEQLEPEARFVRLVDKFMPAVVNLGSESASTMLEDYGIATMSQLREKRSEHAKRLKEMIPEFKDIHDLMGKIWESENDYLFNQKTKHI